MDDIQIKIRKKIYIKNYSKYCIRIFLIFSFVIYLPLNDN